MNEHTDEVCARAEQAVADAQKALASLNETIADTRRFLAARGEAVVVVPGTLTARYLHGAITGWIFSPSEADAGYFGEGTYVREGDEELDVKDQDGPFWSAVRDSFHGSPPNQDDAQFTVRWEC